MMYPFTRAELNVWRALVADRSANGHGFALNHDTVARFLDTIDAAQGMPLEEPRREGGSGASAPASPVLEEDAPHD